jgi:plasmid maintenance system antidote protein VapI
MDLLTLIDQYNRTRPGDAEWLWLNQRRLALAAGVSPSLVTRHIQGKRRITRDVAERYARVLRVSIEEVLDEAA